jgi:heme oxygenase
MIKKMIQSQCSDIPETAFTFFAGYQQQNGSMWRIFLTFFNNALEIEEQQTAAAKAANDCCIQFLRNFQLHYSNHKL